MTGANRGRGLAVVGSVARRLAAGANVYLTGGNPDRVRTAAEGRSRGGVGVRTAVLDVADAAAMEAVAERLSRCHGGLHA